MTKNIIITYTSGAGGEILSAPLINSDQFLSPIKYHRLNDQGRMLAVFNDDFINRFDDQEIHFYQRDWQYDWQKLEQIDQSWLLLIVDKPQVDFLKEKFQDKVIVISLTYDPCLWLFVADSFCKKILDLPNYLTDTTMGKKFLETVAKDQAQKHYFLSLSKKKKLGEWYMDNLMNGRVNWPPKQDLYQGDVVFPLFDLLRKNGLVEFYQNFNNEFGVKVDLDATATMHDKWLERQFLYRMPQVDQ